MPDSRSRQGHQRVHEQWAHLRFAVVGWLLAAPPEKGELRAAITDLAQRRARAIRLLHYRALVLPCGR
jgi:hypothetical protein